MITPERYLQLWKSLDESSRERVLLEVMDVRKELAGEDKRVVDQCLAAVPVPGFRDARHAKLEHLRGYARQGKFGRRGAALPVNFLSAWCYVRWNLLSRLRAEALRRTGSTEQDSAGEDEGAELFSGETGRQLADWASEQFPEAQRQTVELCLAVLRHDPILVGTAPSSEHESASAPDPGEAERQAEAPSAALCEPWQRLLDELEALPAEDSAWSQASEFIAKLDAIAKAKAGAAGLRDRERWAAFLARVQEVSDALSVAEVKHAVGGTPPSNLRSERWHTLVDSIEADLVTLGEILGESPRTRSERASHATRLGEIADRLTAHFASLADDEPVEVMTAGASSSAEDSEIPPAPRDAKVPSEPAQAPEATASEALPAAAKESDSPEQAPLSTGPKEEPGEAMERHGERSEQSPISVSEEVTDAEGPTAPAPASEEATEGSAEPRGPAELQADWLRRGQLVRAMVAAYSVEYRLGNGEILSNGIVPSWMCYLAACCNDKKAKTRPLDVGPFVALLNNLATEPTKRQRFLMAWLAAALLSEGALPAMQCCEQLRPDLWKEDWWDRHDLTRFCRDQVLQPASHGQLLELGSLESTSELERGFKQELEAARQITRMSHSYNNAFVKRVWTSMVAFEGPVVALITETAGGAVSPVPSAHEVAEQVKGWDDVVSSYRNNVLSRLDKCLAHVAAARAYGDRLKRRSSSKSRELNLDQAKGVLVTMKRLQQQLEAEHCPSLGGFQAMHDRLSQWAMSGRGRK